MLHFLVLFIQGNENISIRGGEEFHETFPFRELTARRSNLNVFLRMMEGTWKNFERRKFPCRVPRET